MKSEEKTAYSFSQNHTGSGWLIRWKPILETKENLAIKFRKKKQKIKLLTGSVQTKKFYKNPKKLNQ